MKIVKTVAGLIINDDGKILCTQRDKSKYDYISYKWEFPGGKIEENETEKQTLARELEEELQIKVNILERFYQVEHTYPDFHLSMPIYICALEGGELKLNVHTNIAWLEPKEILSLDWAAADQPVAEKIFKATKSFYKKAKK